MQSESTEQNGEDRPRWKFPWLAAGLVLLFGGLVGLYGYQTRLPDHIVIAGGPPDGRYDQLARSLAAELQRTLGISTEVRSTRGSLENLRLLESGEAVLGLYQSETRAVLQHIRSERKTARFVANLYPEYVIPLAPPDRPVDLATADSRKIACNDFLSGDHAMLTLLLEHIGRDPDECRTIPYLELPAAFENGTVDAVVISCGLDAPVLQHLLVEGKARLLPIPFPDAFEQKHAALTRQVIPAGYFAVRPHPIPQQEFRTVSTQARLLASPTAPVRLVEAATRIVLDPEFQRRVHLTELSKGGTEYARGRPEFPMHAGASHIYSPELRPLLNPDFVEGTEGIRSFLVSIVAAIWLTHRWWKRRQVLSQEHRLDRYIRDVLKIEEDQVGIDGNRPDDEPKLQELLDRVTRLRQAALSEFNAHELNEDQAVDCFVEMCHALSDKISGKLTRHCLRTALNDFDDGAAHSEDHSGS